MTLSSRKNDHLGQWLTCAKYLFLIVMLPLSGCLGGGNYAPVVDREGRTGPMSESYVVSKGDTLFSIAWRYNMDFRKLANANSIVYPYRIYPGQKLLLAESLRVTKPSVATTVSGNSGGTSTSASEAGKQTAKKTLRQSSERSITVSTEAQLVSWSWPAKGRLMHRFQAGSRTHKGIDIAGKLGEPVFAANNGTVVYAGNGLVGYGNLLIIRHAGDYLSAYAHSSELLVAEGQRVRAGQVIARVGDSGTDQTKLHFEIRREGKPLDPLKLLPRR